MTLRDAKPGDVIRLNGALLKACQLTSRGERWCRVVDDDLRETNDIVWIANRTPVLEVVRAQRQGVSESVEVDPLMRGRVR